MPGKIRDDGQRRSIVELRAGQSAEREDAMIIEGKAISFNSPTVLYSYGGKNYMEQIDRRALDSADISDACLRYNHRDAIPMLARIKGGSMTIDVREDGVYFRAELFNTSAARDCYELVRQGALQCSFGFTLPSDGGYVYDADKHLRTITKIERLIDLSIVDVPAYKDTFVSARDMLSVDDEWRIAIEKDAHRRRELFALTI